LRAHLGKEVIDGRLLEAVVDEVASELVDDVS